MQCDFRARRKVFRLLHDKRNALQDVLKHAGTGPFPSLRNYRGSTGDGDVHRAWQGAHHSLGADQRLCHLDREQIEAAFRPPNALSADQRTKVGPPDGVHVDPIFARIDVRERRPGYLRITRKRRERGERGF